MGTLSVSPACVRILVVLFVLCHGSQQFTSPGACNVERPSVLEKLALGHLVISSASAKWVAAGSS